MHSWLQSGRAARTSLLTRRPRAFLPGAKELCFHAFFLGTRAVDWCRADSGARGVLHTNAEVLTDSWQESSDAG